MRQI
jgi:hypothetical protein